MIKNVFTKSASALLALSMAGTATAFADADSVFIGSGNIEITEDYGSRLADKKITISVTDGDYDYTDAATWSNPNSAKIKYFGNGVTDTDGKITFNLNLTDNGIYNVYLACEGETEIKEYRIEYTNQANHEGALALFNQYCKDRDEASLKSLLESQIEDLRVYTDFNVTADFGNVAKLVIAHRNGSAVAMSGDEAKGLLEEAICADVLNSGAMTDVAAAEEWLGMKNVGAEKYYKASNSAAITSMMRTSTITSISDYEKRLTESILTTAINTSDGTAVIQNILTDFKTKYGITKAITNNLCSAIANHGNFSDFNAVLSFVSSYVETGYTPAGGGGGGGNGGGGNVIAPPSSLQTNQNVETTIFDDVPKEHWAANAIRELYYKSIVSGKTETEFCPNDNVKREEFVKMLVEAFGFNLVNDGFELDDVKSTDWYYDSVKTAYAASIVTGTSETTFGAGQLITRQDMSVMIKNALAMADITLEAKQEAIEFADGGNIAGYAKEAIEYLQTAQVISGYPDNTFNPTGNATRAEAAGIIYRLLEYIK